jgi:hypothetical protein
MSFIVQHAKELLGLGDDYHCAALEFLKATNTRPERTRVDLMQAPLFADGKIAWKYAKRSTLKTVIITDEEHRVWLAEWERKTGKCSLCDPKRPGYQYIGWNKDTGAMHRPCLRCGGTWERPGI